MTTERTDPPFDGSTPCPMCPIEVRSVSALLHNFLVRWPERKAYVKLNDLRDFHPSLDSAKFEHPDIIEMMAVAKLLVDACAPMTMEHDMIRWTPEVTKAVSDLIPRARLASEAAHILSEAHFANRGHAHGDIR